MTRLPMALLALAGLALTWSALSRAHTRRQAERSRAQPEPIQTWEGEGGGLPRIRVRSGARATRPT